MQSMSMYKIDKDSVIFLSMSCVDQKMQKRRAQLHKRRSLLLTVSDAWANIGEKANGAQGA